MELEPRTDTHPVRAMLSAVATQTSAMIPAFLTGALAVQMGDDLGFEEGLLGGAVAFFFLLAAVISPHGGAFTDRLGAQRSLRIATSFSAASLIGTPLFVDNYVVLLVMMAVGAVGLGLGGPGTKLMVACGVSVVRHGLVFGI